MVERSAACSATAVVSVTSVNVPTTQWSCSSLITVAVSTTYRVQIVVNAARKAKVYINDQLVYTTAALTDATDLIPYVGVEAAAAAAKSITVYGCEISRAIA